LKLPGDNPYARPVIMGVCFLFPNRQELCTKHVPWTGINYRETLKITSSHKADHLSNAG
jgi:hypothetical protein